MGQIFNVENKLFQTINKLIDCLFLSIAAMILCLPLFTIGAVVSALYYTMHKQLVHNRGYVWSTFWGAFKSNFKNSTKTWLLQLVLTILFTIDIYISYQLLEAGNGWGRLIFVFAIMIVCVLVWALYCMCYFARFDQDRRTVCKNAGLMAVINLPWSIVIAVILLAAAFAAYAIPISIVILPIISIAIYYPIFERIFHKYMTPEDIAKEREENLIDEADF